MCMAKGEIPSFEAYYMPAAMGALCLGKSLMRLFILVLFNFRWRSMVVVLKNTIHFDCMPLVQWIVTG